MVPCLTNMAVYLHTFIGEEESSFAKDYATVFMKEMIKRFPPTDGVDPKKAIILGAGVTLYVLALFVHPYFRGNLLKKISVKEYKLRFEFGYINL
jgi:hypothetical protein